MKYLLKNKNFKTISLLIAVFAIIICLFFIIKKIEAPILPEVIIKKETVEENQNEVKIKDITVINEIKKVELINNEGKYFIKDRSIVFPKDIKGNKKVVLLTIDDGPSSRTLEMIDILKKHNAKAIFFINGSNNRNNPSVIKKTVEEGFTVGNHTWSHLNLKKEKDFNVIKKEVIKNSELIKTLTNSLPKFFRAPYGESTLPIRDFIKEEGMIFMDWSDAALDWEKSTKEKDIFVSNVTKRLAPGSIILIHEHPWSLANLDSLLTILEKDGYTYVDPNNIVE